MEAINLLNRLERSIPSDVIYLTHKSDKMLTDLWSIPQSKSTGCKQVYVPSDLFQVGTVPLLDCKIIIDETNDLVDGLITTVRVKIFPEYQDWLKNAPDDVDVLVGVVSLDVPKGYVALPLCMSQSEEKLGFIGEGLIMIDGKAEISSKASVAMDVMWQCLTTWYGIQIALLHPVVHNIFRNPGRSAVEKSSRKQKSKKHRKSSPVKYVKKHIINQNELQNLVYGESGSKTYQRKALVWYVIGHWRTYKNGKRVFVQPHWKGALRDTNLTQSREREIVLN